MESLKKFRIDLIIYFVLLLTPVTIWIYLEPVTERFSTFTLTMLSLGQLTGLVGMTLVALSMIFQIRLSRFFGFIASKPTTISNLHHYSGVYGLFLLILHPLLLVYEFLPVSTKAAWEFLFTTNKVNLAGLVALIIMIISIYASLFVPRSFKYWKLLHQIMLVAYIFILYHLLFVTSDISRSLLLRSYLLTLTGLGGFAFAWQKTSYYLKKSKAPMMGGGVQP